MAKSKNSKLKYSLIAIGVVILAFLVLIVVKSPTTNNPNASDAVAPASLIQKVTSVSSDVFKAVGIGTVTNPPKPINGPAIPKNGKPQIVYMGAEYCPYCATERWPMVIALSRFGSFSNLKTTHSSLTDVYSDTQTFSFHGSSYSSPYIVFTPVELFSNVPSGSAYTALDQPTSAEQSLQNTYDSPPYVPSSSAGAIPFIYFNGKYLITGASYSPTVLQGKTADQIASALSNPNDLITKGAVGAANAITAAICGMTGNQPAGVCNSDIQSIETSLNSGQ